jgi:hypothetical protein
VQVMHDLDPARSPSAIFADLGADERALIAACAELYAGCWDDLAEDVRRRQSGQPYLFRLRQDPGETLVWSGRFKAYEAARGARLVDALPPEDAR